MPVYADLTDDRAWVAMALVTGVSTSDSFDDDPGSDVLSDA